MRLPGSILQGILARAALMVLRVFLGIMFLASAWPKLSPGYPPQLVRMLESSGGAGAHPMYQEFARQILLPRAAMFALLIAWGELLVGVCLVLGLATRAAAALGFLLAANFMLGEGAWFWTPSSSYAAWAVISLALMVGAAGRTLGLDAFLAKRWPRSPFW
jgi:thiosulfate dehydrogenase [quinone] large subunit